MRPRVLLAALALVGAGWFAPEVARFRVGADGRAAAITVGDAAGAPTLLRNAGR